MNTLSHRDAEYLDDEGILIKIIKKINFLKKPDGKKSDTADAKIDESCFCNSHSSEAEDFSFLESINIYQFKALDAMKLSEI